ncbi:hypothetical protein AB0J40_33845 [Amycolatopsis sp. NPDC049691]|uniref:hypothetical protein n=1 Tax=Amycolatopsis sp. NPDC049691 TaxID=3155155 RepID=UPI00342A947D
MKRRQAGRNGAAEPHLDCADRAVRHHRRGTQITGKFTLPDARQLARDIAGG